MADLKVNSNIILNISKIDSEDYLEFNYPYKVDYEKFNKKIIKNASKGLKEIQFDFIDSELYQELTVKEMKKTLRRVYLLPDQGQASLNMFDYPLYLISRGFTVKVGNPQKIRGYSARSYIISW